MKSNAELVENYRDYYKKSEREWRELCAKEKSDHILTLCQNKEFNRVLEIGAGEGAVLQELSNRCFSQELYALEISDSAIDSINNRDIPQLKEAGLFDGYDTKYQDKYFDLVVLSHVIEHVEHPRLLLYEARRIAKYVFVEVPLEDNHSMRDNFKFDKVGHLNYYNPKTIKFLLQSSGLRVIKQSTLNPSKEVFKFQQGKIGLIKYYIKEIMLKLFPNAAPNIFTYQSFILTESKDKLYS